MRILAALLLLGFVLENEITVEESQGRIDGPAAPRQVHMPGFMLHRPTAQRDSLRNLDETGPDHRCNQDLVAAPQNEITLATWRLNTDIVLVGANDSRLPDGYSAGFYRSLDGGETWQDALLARGPAGRFDGAGDPVACIDNSGRMYACYLALELDSLLNGIYVQTSVDSGLTWGEPVAVVEVLGGYPRPIADKPMAATDISLDSPYQGNLYITWTHNGTSGSPIHFSSSFDGGQSFSDPIQISTSNRSHMSCPTVGPEGEVYAVWFERVGVNTFIRFDRSLDGGMTWGPDTEVSPAADTGRETDPCGIFRTPSYPVVACDISHGPRRGWIYVCWANWNGTDADVMICHSEDNGLTWSIPTRVNDDMTNAWQWWPWIAVHPETGELGASWLDRREDPAGCLFRAWGAISRNGGITWGENMPIASELSDPGAIEFLGDYTGLTFRHHGFYAGWVDTRNDDGDCYVAWFRDNPYQLVIDREGNHARLRWNPITTEPCRITYGDDPDGPFHTLIGITSDSSIVDSNAFSESWKRYYQVSVSAPE